MEVIMQSNYWHIYYDQDVVAKSDKRREEHQIRSTGVDIHMDVYPHPDPQAPVVIFNHGAAGYCRHFVKLAFLLGERGYTVVLPDQRGQGLSGGRSGDYKISECVQNIVDVAKWAKKRFQAPIFMGGGSMGGGITYYAAAAGAPVEAITCLNIFDYGNGVDSLQISRFAFLANSTFIVKAFKLGMALMKPFYGIRIPFNWMGAFDKLMDERDSEYQEQWDADPVPPRRVSLRFLASTMDTDPAVPFENNQIPVLVINQTLDQMVVESVTRENYERLGGPKRYVEIPFGHWSSQPEFWISIVDSCDDWFKRYLAKSTQN
jgi:alpha-beta hydrolase superfamily lysophospholipase